MSLSSSMIQPESGWPDLTPSTTTTPTPSPSSCTTKWITCESVNVLFGEALFYSHARPPRIPARPRRARRPHGGALARAGQPEAALRRGVVQSRRPLGLSAAPRLHALDAPRADP